MVQEGIFMDVDAHCLRLFLRRAYAGLLIHVLTITRCPMPNGNFATNFTLSGVGTYKAAVLGGGAVPVGRS